jgi:hypothetical protein
MEELGIAATATAIPVATTPARVDPGPLRLELDRTRAMLEEVRRRADALERELDSTRVERAELRQLLAMVQTQLGRLIAPPNESQETAEQPPSKPWYRRILALDKGYNLGSEKTYGRTTRL